MFPRCRVLNSKIIPSSWSSSRTHLILSFPRETHVTSELQKYVFSYGISLVTELTLCFCLTQNQPLFCGSHLKPSVAGDKHYSATTKQQWKQSHHDGHYGAARGCRVDDKGIDSSQSLYVCVVKGWVEVGGGGGSIRGKIYGTAGHTLSGGSGTTGFQSLDTDFKWTYPELSRKYLTFTDLTQRWGVFICF